MPIQNIEVVPESVNRNKFPVGSQVLVQNHLLDFRSRKANDLWVGPFSVERCVGDICFLVSSTGRQILLPVNQRDLRGYIPDLT